MAGTALAVAGLASIGDAALAPVLAVAMLLGAMFVWRDYGFTGGFRALLLERDGRERASVTVNGTPLPRAPVPREIAGQRLTTAMLAFSETWIRVCGLAPKFAQASVRLKKATVRSQASFAAASW